MHLFGELNQRDLVVICSRVSGFVRHSDRDVLADVIRGSSPQTWQFIDELSYATCNHCVLSG